MSSPKDHSESSSGPVYTARGRPLDSGVNKKGEVDRTIQPVPTRQRAYSLRRLPTENLEQLAKGHPSGAVQSGANREIEVRQHLIAESTLQQKIPGAFQPHPVMASKGPVGMQEVEALRFASSMAEEAQSEVNTQNKTQNKLGQLGVANVGGHLGMGFSGKSKEEVAHTKNVEKQMLVLQQHYQSQGLADHWSTQLQGTQVSEVTADGANVCAAKRAAHVANSAAYGADYYLPSIERQQMPPPEMLPPIKREQIPSPDTLIEMMSPATSVFGGMQKPFSVMQNKSPLFSKQEQGGTTVATRTRSQSVQNMANSCDECQKEFAEKMGQREHK